jgi:hypothetical protein
MRLLNLPVQEFSFRKPSFALRNQAACVAIMRENATTIHHRAHQDSSDKAAASHD